MVLSVKSIWHRFSRPRCPRSRCGTRGYQRYESSPLTRYDRFRGARQTIQTETRWNTAGRGIRRVYLRGVLGHRSPRWIRRVLGTHRMTVTAAERGRHDELCSESATEYDGRRARHRMRCCHVPRGGIHGHESPTRAVNRRPRYTVFARRNRATECGSCSLLAVRGSLLFQPSVAEPGETAPNAAEEGPTTPALRAERRVQRRDSEHESF